MIKRCTPSPLTLAPLTLAPLTLAIAAAVANAGGALQMAVATGMALQAAGAAGAPEWIQLMPSGTWRARDGRGPYSVSDPAAVVAATRAAIADGSGGLPIDYDHAAEAAGHGIRAPAAGWIEDVEARADGIWGRVAWTEKAALAIAAREYRFVSPVFLHDKQGRIATIVRAGLTNTPAFRMAAVAASEQPAEDLMNEEQLKALRIALGCKEDVAADAIVAAATTQQQSARAAGELLGKLRGALGVDDKADLVQAAAALKQGAASQDDTEVDKLQKQIAAMQTQMAAEKATAAVDDAVKAGKLAPAQRDWAIGYASRDPAGFAGFIKDAPPLLGKGAPDGSPATGAGTADAGTVEICRQLGISVDDYKKTVAAAEQAAAQTGAAR